MTWIAFNPRKDGFIFEVRDIWERTYYPVLVTDGKARKDSEMVGKYQVVRFFKDPGYYVRCAAGNADYTKEGCFPQPCKTLTKAREVAEMLNAMEGA